MLNLRIRIFYLLTVVVLLPCSLLSQEADTSLQEYDLKDMDLDEINRRLENPMTNIWSLTFQENLYLNQGEKVEGTEVSNVFFFQPFMPFPLTKKYMLIIRPVFPLVSQPYQLPNEEGSATGRETGFGDMQLITAFGPDRQSGLVWGIGPTFKFPTATSPLLGNGKWQAGPSALLIYIKKPWTYGLIFQHWSSFAGDPDRPDVNVTDIQYIFRRSFPGAWSLGMGPNITINWEAEEGNRLTFPIGLGITKTVRWGIPFKLRIEPQYSIIKPEDYGTEWNIRIQIAPVINRPLKSRN